MRQVDLVARPQSPQWVETVCRRRVHFIQKKTLSHKLGNERNEQASKQMKAVEGASKASSPDERVAQYSMSVFLNHSAHRGG